MARSKEKEQDDVLYGRSPLGQLLYDLAFTDLTPKYLALKHGITAPEVSELRSKARAAMLPKRRPKAWRDSVIESAVEFNRALDGE